MLIIVRRTRELLRPTIPALLPCPLQTRLGNNLRSLIVDNDPARLCLGSKDEPLARPMRRYQVKVRADGVDAEEAGGARVGA